MKEKMVLMDVEGTFLRDEVAVMLKKLVDDVALGKLTTADGEVPISGQLRMDCKGKFKPKGEGSKGSITIELSWFVPNSQRIGV